MNRPGPQNMRGMPAGFGAPQQQPAQPPARTANSRLPNGKTANSNNNATGGWSFGAGGSMGGNAGGVQNVSRQMGGSLSFAQSLSGSQPAAPLDLSDFPSLSGNPQHSSASQPSMWSAGGARAMPGVQRNQPTPISSQQGGFPGQGTATPTGSRTGNGLLNALNSNSRPDPRSPDSNSVTGNTRSSDTRSVRTNDEPRSKPPGFRDENLPSHSSPQDSPADSRHPLGVISSIDSLAVKEQEDSGFQAQAGQDPLSGMTEIDKWGIKGLRTLMHNYPDYSSLVTGMDPQTFGLDLATPAPISSQIYSLWNDAPPRPPIPDHRLPECYKVNNVQPLQAKISSFNEETLMWIFYSCPGDVQQQQAAQELNNRNWRWHKKLKIWLTKDDIMQPRQLSGLHEEGYYIIWNTKEWRKERRTLVLYYEDLETLSQSAV
ncbi:CCR4-NOT transcription complex subunit 2 [Microdochium nivale]|nr:CCR4-NOT transcription complex subunit 2 [Microdochium nivale]